MKQKLFVTTSLAVLGAVMFIIGWKFTSSTVVLMPVTALIYGLAALNFIAAYNIFKGKAIGRTLGIIAALLGIVPIQSGIITWSLSVFQYMILKYTLQTTGIFIPTVIVTFVIVWLWFWAILKHLTSHGAHPHYRLLRSRENHARAKTWYTPQNRSSKS